MNIVAIIIIVICGLLALFNFINLYCFARRFFIYWRHPDRDFLETRQRGGRQDCLLPCLPLPGQAGMAGRVRPYPALQRLPDRETFLL